MFVNLPHVKTEYLQVQLIEHVFVREGEDVDKVLWKKEKY